MPSPLRFRILKDPWSWATHFAGFLAAIVGLVFLVSHASHNATKLVAMTTYGVSLVTLFAASSMYHFFDLGLNGNRWLRRIDHCAIFFLIAVMRFLRSLPLSVLARLTPAFLTMLLKLLL